MPGRAARRRRLALAAVLLIGAALRVARFPDVPAGLNPDEVAAAYEAWSLLETGKDRWGAPWPAYFTAWGSGQNVLYSWLLVPVIAAFGLSTATIRLPALVLGVLTLPLFHATLRRSGGGGHALLATALLAVLPWHVMASRWALESNLLPFCLLSGVAATLAAERRPRWIPLAFAPWAIALYAYLVAAPTIACLLGLELWRQRASVRARPLPWIAALLVFGALAAPAATVLAKNVAGLPTGVVERLLPLSVPALPAQRWSQVAEPFADRIAANLALAARGLDDGLPWNQSAELPLGALAPWAVAAGALLAAVRARRRGLDPFLAWTLACLPLAFVTTLNLNRANAFLLPAVALAARALRAADRAIAPGAPRALARVAAAGVLATGTVRFGVDYFLAPPRTAGGFHAGLEPAYRRARRLAAGRPILISNSVGIAYLYPLLFDRVRPAQFQAARAARPGPEGPLSIRNVGDVYFHRHEIPHEREGEWIALRPAGEVDPLEEIVLERVGGWALVEPRRGDATAR